jgi:hypothetical protein
MLLPDPLVGDRHLPPSEINDLRPKILMLLKERSATSVGHELPRLFVKAVGCPSAGDRMSVEGLPVASA